jgi:quinone-modifying oxidoreductase subunit QmoC
MVLFGFFGAAATAGLALIYMVVWMGQHPGEEFPGLSLGNPIKWLGIISGLCMVVGSALMIVRRVQNTDEVGADGYADKLFLWMILLVAGTGLLTWLLRLAAVPAIAYPVYFVHLTVVFFLLWYMPYSKFAHMIYRGLALVWAQQTNRVTPRATA